MERFPWSVMGNESEIGKSQLILENCHDQGFPGRGFPDILDFRKANAFYPSLPESGIQRDLIEGLYMPLPPEQ